MTAKDAITFYWRPGCPFCSRLEHQMVEAAIAYEKRNIWEDPAHAAVVRSLADGNETVPTVVVGEGSLVNPSLAELIELMRTETPHLVPADS